MGRTGDPRDGGPDERDDSQSLDYREEERQEDLLEAKMERKFLLKLDACLMTWAWLAYLIKVGGCVPGAEAPLDRFMPGVFCELHADRAAN